MTCPKQTNIITNHMWHLQLKTIIYTYKNQSLICKLHICEVRLKGWSQNIIMLRTQMLQEQKKRAYNVFISLMMVGNKHNENQVATKQKVWNGLKKTKVH